MGSKQCSKILGNLQDKTIFINSCRINLLEWRRRFKH